MAILYSTSSSVRFFLPLVVEEATEGAEMGRFCKTQQVQNQICLFSSLKFCANYTISIPIDKSSILSDLIISISKMLCKQRTFYLVLPIHLVP